MSLPKKIVTMAASIAGIAFLLAAPVSAQTPASGSPKMQVDSSTPASEAAHKKVMATRHSWSKKHHPKTASGTHKPPKPKAANGTK